VKAVTGIEFFRQKVALNDDHVYHIIDVTEEQRKRIKNDGDKPKTRVQFETDDPEFYSAFAVEKDRIIKRAGNKTLALHMMLVAWRRMSNALIDELIAAEEGPPI
jgi:hypothetical protein